LVAISEIPNQPRGKERWLCKCDCGNDKETFARYLLSGDVKSCGCLYKEQNTSGMVGVHFDKRSKRWVATLTMGSRKRISSSHPTFEEAAQARKDMESKYRNK
jgi:hypothetical protein